MEVTEVRIDRQGWPNAPYVWRATVTFTTTYNLPDGVIESAIIRAIGQSPLAHVESLHRSALGADPSGGGTCGAGAPAVNEQATDDSRSEAPGPG